MESAFVVRARGEEAVTPLRVATLKDDPAVLDFIATRGKKPKRTKAEGDRWRVSEVYVGPEVSRLVMERLREVQGPRIVVLLVSVDGQIVDGFSLSAERDRYEYTIEIDATDRLLFLESSPTGWAEPGPVFRLDLEGQCSIADLVGWSRSRSAVGQSAPPAGFRDTPGSGYLAANPSDAAAEIPGPDDATPAPDHAEGMADSASDRLARLRACSRLKLFAKVDELYLSAPPAEQLSFPFLLAWLDSAANQGRHERIVELCSRLSGAPRQYRSASVLIHTNSYGSLLPDDLRDWLRAAAAQALPDRRVPLARIVHFAHECLSTAHWPEFEQARNAAEEAASDSLQRARCDLLSSQLCFVLGNRAGQVEQINRSLARFGVNPVALLDRSRGFSASNVRMIGALESTATDGPLVSVIMTTFNRSASLRHAIQSVLDQSHANIELIVVDDASSDDTPDVVGELARADSRIRQIRLAENGGTYVAKNHGLRVARGAYVTCQDSDDWAHPQKLEVQVAALAANPEVVAVTVQHVRCNEAQGLKSRIGYLRKDFSSLMFRRDTVLERAGYFDSVRAGADGEFHARLERIWGPDHILHLPHLLSIVDWAAGSLTGGGPFAMNDELGTMSPLRHAYRRAFIQWHSREPKPFVGFPLDHRPFELAE